MTHVLYTIVLVVNSVHSQKTLMEGVIQFEQVQMKDTPQLLPLPLP